jgi:hypothetical protein
MPIINIINKCNEMNSEKIHKNNNINFYDDKIKQYVCKMCEFKCLKKSNYEKHITTKKHLQNENIKEEEKNSCECGKMYKQHSSLWKHKQKCNSNNYNEKVFKELMHQNISLITTTKEFKTMIIEQQKQIQIHEKIQEQIQEQNKIITEIASRTNTTINNKINNQINNQQFNLNMFLNETCKDAMNLSEFIENLEVSMEDMEKTGELGFAKGMSRIIMNNLNAIDVCKRPIHCSDVKRETLYVKNNGVWEKETEERKRTKEVIYRISSLNIKQLLKWRDLPRNKGYEKSEHKKNDEFTKLVMEINKLREEEIDKVITNISKHVAIDKDRVKMSGYLN